MKLDAKPAADDARHCLDDELVNIASHAGGSVIGDGVREFVCQCSGHVICW